MKADFLSVKIPPRRDNLLFKNRRNIFKQVKKMEMEDEVPHV